MNRQPRSRLVSGIDLVGPLPEEVQDTVTYQAAIMPNASDNEPLSALINYLRTPEAIAVIKAMGMEPG